MINKNVLEGQRSKFLIESNIKFYSIWAQKTWKNLCSVSETHWFVEYFDFR
jgi:hypothetical protein